MTIAYPKGKFWHNLISIKGGLFGEQTAGWTPGSPAMTDMGCQVLADQMIPMSDGILLASDVYLPTKPGRYPAVLVFGAYTKELHAAGVPAATNEVGSPPIFTNRGYAHIIVARRGMSRSGGETGVFFNDQDVADHEELVAWAASQAWCDGQVVLYGISYFGCTQLQVASRRPPALKGFFCSEICTDYYRHIVAFGGSPALYFLSLWMGANFTQAIINLKTPPLLRAAVSHIVNSPLKRIWWPQLKKRLPAIMRALAKNTPIRPVRDMWQNWIFDGKTRATSVIPAGSYPELKNIEVPFVTIQSLAYFNLHQFGSYELFEKASTPASRKWMIMAEAAYELPVYSWQLEALAFFDHITRGTENGYASQPPVRYWLDGSNNYFGASDFPIPNSETLRLYPAPDGSDDAVHELTREAPSQGSNRWAALPRGAPLMGGMDKDINQTLTYDFEVSEDTELTGPIKASLVFSCNEIDSYVIARLGRVDTDRGYHFLSLGAISPARRKIDTARGSSTEIAIDIDTPEPLVPGQPVRLTFSLTPAPTVVKKGEKLRLEIASRTDLLESDTGHDHPHFHLEVPPYFSRNTLHCGPETYVEVQKVSKRAA